MNKPVFTNSSKSQICTKLQQAFPKNLANDVQKVADFVANNSFSLHSTLEQEVILNAEKLLIPSRIYDENPSTAIGGLTNTQQTILNCLYLRHYNGFVRQKYLEKLIQNTQDYFVIPYIFQLLGEYVVEILAVASEHINEKNIAHYQKFIAENPKYAQQTQSRMTSYWDAYYRTQYPDLKHYIGYKIFKTLKTKS